MRYLLPCILFIFSFSPGKGQDIIAISGQNFEQYTPGTARKLLIDRYGYLWLGTNNGVIRYDGYTYTSYKQNLLDSAGFWGTRVSSLFEDHRGGIWAGTNKGVNYLAPGSDSFVNRKPDSAMVLEIIEDKNNNIWLTTHQNIIKISDGLLSDSNIFRYQQDTSVQLIKLFITNEGKLLGIGNGYFEIEEDINNKRLDFKPLIQNTEIKDIMQLDDSTLMLLADHAYFIHKQGRKIIRKSVDSNPKIRSKMVQDNSGDIWVGLTQGFARVRINRNYDLISQDFYRAGMTTDIAIDASGNLFFARAGRGMLKLGWNYKQYKHFYLPEEFKDSWVHKFIEDDSSNLWVGTLNGLFYFNEKDNTFKTYLTDAKNPHSLPDQTIYSLLMDKDHNFWAATGNGVVKYDKYRDQFIRAPVEGLSHHFFQDTNKKIWFVSNHRLFRLDPDNLEVTSFEEIEGQRQSIQQIFLDKEQTLWAWYQNYGLKRLPIENGVPQLTDRIYLPTDGLVEAARWMEEDNLGRIWVSEEVGVYVLEKKSGKILKFFNSSNSSLEEDHVDEIIRDDYGRMWLKQAKHGSISVEPETFKTVGFNPVWLYTIPAQAYSCVAARGKDGKLFTDGKGEFGYFYPDSLRINKVPPSVVLSGSMINNESVLKLPDDLNYSQNNLEFSFCGIQFDNPDRNQYSYFLKGYDKDWISADKTREARYSGLPPGSYTFFVKASNSDGVWSNEKLLASFTILPPWWQTIWAYSIYAALLILLITIFYRLQLHRKMAMAETEKLKEIDDFKNKFFTNITHEFRTPLTVITGVAEQVDGEQGILIKRNAEQLLTFINQILELSRVEANVNRLKPETFDVFQHCQYILQSVSTLASDKSVSLNLKRGAKGLYVLMDRDKFTLVLQNLITNAIKFTHAGGSVSIDVTRQSDQLILKVIDTGVGISPQELPYIFNRFYQADNQQSNWKGTGIGLALTQELVQLMKGTIAVSSNLGEGTTFTVTWPLVESTSLQEKDVKVNVEEVTRITDEEKIFALLIEDNSDVALVINEVLKDKYNVVTASNGREGVDLAIEHVPDIIISDVMMPQMNGFEVTQHLKGDRRTSHIPIILLTAKADIESKLEGLAYGADAYLGKPFNSKELLLHIQNLIRLRDALKARYGGGEIISAKSENQEDRFIVSLQKLVYENLSDDEFGIEEICRNLGISRTQLHRKLKALTGKSTSIYIRDLRLAEGRRMLHENSHTVAEVAYATGFSDPNYFTRLFTEKYGHTPTKERKI